MNGAPAHIKFEGKDYVLSPLTLGDMEEFESWAKQRRHDEAEDHIARLAKHDAAPPEKRAQIIDAAAADCASGVAEARAARSAGGMGLLLWHSLRRRQPDVTIEQAKRIVEFQGFEKVERLIDEISGLAGPEGTPANPQTAAGASAAAATATGGSASSAS